MKKIYLFLLGCVLAACFVACSSEDQVNSPQGDTNLPEATIKGELITLQSGAVVEKRDGMYFYGGDIALSDNQLSRLDITGDIFYDPKEMEVLKPTDSTIVSVASGMRAHYENTNLTKAGGRHPYENAYWAMVRFTFGKNLSSSARSKAVQAIRHIEAQTNVRFYNATGQPTSGYGINFPYVEIIDNSDPTISWSYLGRIGGRQELAIGAYASVGSVIHEFCHAVAMFHEHQRYDRDNYITVNYGNIESGQNSQFDKRTTNYYIIGNFDFNSIMLYDSYSFSKNGSPTMTTKGGQVFWANRTGLSDLDRRWLNSFYIPYIARSDVYAELAETVYWSDNTKMTPQERLDYQAYLNNGNPYPPSGGRIPNIIE